MQFVKRGRLLVPKRSFIPPQDFVGSGHPSDALGVAGNTYTRSDRNGWIYTKQVDGTWKLTTVGTGAPDIFGAANQAYYASPYVTFVGQRGDVQTHGKSWSSPTNMGLNAIGSSPSNANGSDGNLNLEQVTDPVHGGLKKALKIRFLEADADSGGSGSSRTMIRYLGDALTSPSWTDNNSTRLTLRMRTQYWFGFGLCIPTALYNYFNTTQPSAISVMWQIHDNSIGTLSPNFEISLAGRTNTSNGKASGAVAISMCLRGNPNPRVVAGSGSGTGGTQTNFGTLETVTPDQWMYFLVGGKLAWQASDSPRTEVYSVKGSGSWTKRVDSTVINAYNADSGGIDYDHYISFGQYMWANVNTGASFTNYWKDMVVSKHDGWSPTADELADAQQWLQAR